MMYAQAPSPAHQWAPQILTGSNITHAPTIKPERYSSAIAAIGAGLNHLAGEALIALADEDLDSKKFTCGAVVTDRRFLARSEEICVDIPYSDLSGVQANTGIILDDLVLMAWGRSYKLPSFTEVKPIRAFLQAMLGVHPAYRVPPPRPLLHPSADDPTGAGGARMGIWSGDPRVLPLLGMAYEGHKRGWFSAETGADFASRALLFDRTLFGGRGSSEGWWTSPLGAPDLAYAFSCMLGPPISVHQESNARVFTFRLERKANVGRAVVSAVGLVALGVLGVGWVSGPGKQLREFSLRIAPGNSSSGFALFEGNTPLSKEWPRVLQGLFEVLPRIEGRILLQRTAWGWEAPPEQLEAAPVEALYQKVCSAIGEVDLQCFFPPPPT